MNILAIGLSGIKFLAFYLRLNFNKIKPMCKRLLSVMIILAAVGSDAIEPQSISHSRTWIFESQALSLRSGTRYWVGQRHHIDAFNRSLKVATGVALPPDQVIAIAVLAERSVEEVIRVVGSLPSHSRVNLDLLANYIIHISNDSDWQFSLVQEGEVARSRSQAVGLAYVWEATHCLIGDLIADVLGAKIEEAVREHSIHIDQLQIASRPGETMKPLESYMEKDLWKDVFRNVFMAVLLDLNLQPRQNLMLESGHENDIDFFRLTASIPMISHSSRLDIVRRIVEENNGIFHVEYKPEGSTSIAFSWRFHAAS